MDVDVGCRWDAAKSENETSSLSVSSSTSVSSVATANHWKMTSLASHLGNKCLVINTDVAENVVSLKGEGDEKLFVRLSFQWLKKLKIKQCRRPC